MNLTAAQKRVIERVINVFETGTPDGNYSDVTLLRDGPGGIRQITYGRSQTTEWGNLKTLLTRYCDAPDAQQAKHIRPYLAKMGKISQVGEQSLLAALRAAGHDPVMRAVQDSFFDDVYYRPAERWATENGFALALSMLVIYDSYIHSGSIRKDIRSRFPEVPPVRGGNEKAWITAYVAARHAWLANHSKTILHGTVYRTVCLRNEIRRNNWNLAILPIIANGTAVT